MREPPRREPDGRGPDGRAPDGRAESDGWEPDGQKPDRREPEGRAEPEGREPDGQEPDSQVPSPTSTPRPPAVARLPFPLVDEISRHCLRDDEPETVHIEVHLPGRIDHTRLRTAFHRALLRHPRILMRQAPVSWWRRRYEWELTATPDVDPVVFPPPGPDALVRARERALTACPPLDASPPVRLEVVERHPDAADGTVLVLTLHHTALDGPACLRVLATTAELYGGADNSPAPPPVRTPERTAPPRHRAPAARPGLVRPARIAPDHDDPGRPPHPRDHSHTEGPSPVPATVLVTTSAPVGPTDHTNGMLITELPVPTRPPREDTPAPNTPHAAPRTTPPTVNDQLLVATCLTVARWNRLHGRPTRPVIVTMPVDDRPRGGEMPIGNGTRLIPVGFGPEEQRDADLLAADPPDPEAVALLLRRTAARTRALKATRGSQLGLPGTLLTLPVAPVGLRGAATRALRTAAAPWTSTTLLSNIGRLPYPLDFGDAGRPTAVWFSAPARMPRGLTVTTVSVGGRIQLALRWSRALLDDAAGARFGALFAASLAATEGAAP
ncbi:condensation protein [Streptomyces natalensis ATCC 27448]|uniref:Condensation protein n=1 Tax=Streptomyces natalensis ATCC 27448 TaxID=1240678 RepID=A0A0D7CRJ0_9ACTN|nr:condensation protein [Streptomyces natalensis ATCC 27448]